LPGLEEVWASEELPVRQLIREDLPTFERPIKANSVLAGLGLLAAETELATYTALEIFIVEPLSVQKYK
jgi:hypothetical protein